MSTVLILRMKAKVKRVVVNRNSRNYCQSLRGSDCVAGVHNDEICGIEDSSESGEEDFDEI